MKIAQHTIWSGVIVIGVPLLAGCGNPSPDSVAGANAHQQTAKSSTVKDDSASIKVTAIADSEPDRYLIKNATLTLETRDVRATENTLIADSRAVKGYVSDMHETVDGLGERTVTLKVRVPFSEFDSFMQRFESFGKVLDKQVNAEDVTEEFVDTQSTLRNLKATEARLLAHLSKTGRLSDTLLVEKEITRVREETDKLEGRLRFLAHRVAFSTLDVTLHEAAHSQAITPPETFSTARVVSDAARTLVVFGQAVWTIVIWLGLWSIVWLPIALLVGYLHRRNQALRPRPPVIPPLP